MREFSFWANRHLIAHEETEGGADDYVTKPFSFQEVLARVRVRLRDATTTDTTMLEAGGITLDLRTPKVSVNGLEIDLSAREFSLAETLLGHPGQVLSREQLLSLVWGYDFEPGSNVVDVYIGYLRRKLGDAAIETVRGMGYRFIPLHLSSQNPGPSTYPSS